MEHGPGKRVMWREFWMLMQHSKKTRQDSWTASCSVVLSSSQVQQIGVRWLQVTHYCYCCYSIKFLNYSLCAWMGKHVFVPCDLFVSLCTAWTRENFTHVAVSQPPEYKLSGTQSWLLYEKKVMLDFSIYWLSTIFLIQTVFSFNLMNIVFFNSSWVNCLSKWLLISITDISEFLYKILY